MDVSEDPPTGPRDGLVDDVHNAGYHAADRPRVACSGPMAETRRNLADDAPA